MTSTHAIILAAGKGSRMNSDLPKVLHPLKGRPMIHYVLDAARDAGIEQFVVVIGHGREKVKAQVSKWQQDNSSVSIRFAVQEQQNGTGHAVQVAKQYLPQTDANIVVLLGDVPLVKPETLLSALSDLSQSAALVVSMQLKNPTGYGRIIRSSQGELLQIVEEKDANPKQKKVSEVNTGLFVFQAEKLWQYLDLLNTQNAQNELYLTDIMQILRENQEEVVADLFGEPEQFEGVNSLDQLLRLENFLIQRTQEARGGI